MEPQARWNGTHGGMEPQSWWKGRRGGIKPQAWWKGRRGGGKPQARQHGSQRQGARNSESRRCTHHAAPLHHTISLTQLLEATQLIIRLVIKCIFMHKSLEQLSPHRLRIFEQSTCDFGVGRVTKTRRNLIEINIGCIYSAAEQNAGRD